MVLKSKKDESHVVALGGIMRRDATI